MPTKLTTKDLREKIASRLFPRIFAVLVIAFIVLCVYFRKVDDLLNDPEVGFQIFAWVAHLVFGGFILCLVAFLLSRPLALFLSSINTSSKLDALAAEVARQQSMEEQKTQAAEAKRRKEDAERLEAAKSSVHDAVKNRDLEKITALLKDKPGQVNSKDTFVFRPPNPHNRGIEGATPLHGAAYEGFKDAAETLIANGADVNAKARDGTTPLHWAAEKGDKSTIELLLANGADVNAKLPDFTGETPLCWAAKKGNKSTVELLLANGANVNCSGTRPLHVAITHGHTEVAELLRQHGASRSFQDLTSDAGPIGQIGGRIMYWVMSAVVLGIIMFLSKACEINH